MEEMMKEVSLEELEKANGGSGGYARKPKEKAGCWIYKIRKGDTLGKIAATYNTTVDEIKKINSTIHDVNDITANFYIYIPN